MLRFGVGSLFGALTVIKILRRYRDHANHSRIMVQVRCQCGRYYNLPSYNLTRGTSRQCRRCSYDKRTKIRIGQRYDSFLIIGFTKGSDDRRLAKCRCDCGQTVLIRPDLLLHNITNNCGCRPRGKWNGVGNISGTLMYRMKRNAKNRGWIFNLSPRMLWRLFLEQKQKCALTGLPIIIDPNCKITTASLDRKNSLKGYSRRNIQWVHKDINLMKMDLPQNRFFELCQLISSMNRK